MTYENRTMKICIIADTHIGARNDNPIVQDYFGEFYENIFFPELKKRGIDTIIHAGDVFDRRKFVNFVSLHKANKYFFDNLVKNNITMHVILGNHDCFYKSTNVVNSLKEILSDKKNIHIYEKPTDVKFGSLSIMMLPWMNPENHAQFMKDVKNSSSDWLVGHLELTGFDMHKGQPCEHGDDAKNFKHFEQVLTGHFHTQSVKDNIRYLGSPYEMTWIDHEDPKGFHILDTETRTLEFVKNPISLHEKIYYNDVINGYAIGDMSHLKNKIVKLIVEKKTNHGMFDAYVDNINKHGPLNFTIVEDMSSLVVVESDDAANAEKDTITLIDEYIDDIQNEIDTDRLKQIVKNLYNEAQQ